MYRELFFLCILPFLIAGGKIDSDDEEFKLQFFCGIRDPFDVYYSRVVRVLPKLNMEINGAGIVSIRHSVFAGCGGTVTLSMADNKLANLTGKRLEGLRNLKKANFFNNVIEYIENGTFDGLPYLQELELSYNLLDGLDADVRSGLGELRKLHLNRNPIVLREDGFLGLSKLELLELTGANISAIPNDTFNGLGNLRRLDLSRNNLTDISKSRFEALINLEELDLSMNQISKISKHTFKGLVNLKSLWLNGNRIRSLKGHNIFKWIPNLTNLYLHKNPLRFFNIAVFRKLRNVVIEPGFVVDFSETIRKNFARSKPTLYQCSRLYNLQDATQQPIKYTEDEESDYYAPYYCVVLPPVRSATVSVAQTLVRD